jgi:demethylspheroidene O-methyltransferase
VREARLGGSRSPRSIGERWFNFRNRVLSDAHFQQWATRFPLTRATASRHANELFNLCAGFVYSQVLYAVVDLGVLEAIADGVWSVRELQEKLSMSESATRRLLDAAASLKLVEARGDGYGLGILGAALLANEAILAMVRHHALLYRDLADPVRLLRAEQSDTALRRFWPYSARGAYGGGDAVAFSELMAVTASFVVPEILDAYPPHRHRRLLDVCGGSGALLVHAGRLVPNLSLVLFELPEVASIAEKTFADAGLSWRAKVVAGDVLLDSLPRGADLISLVRVIHDHDDTAALRILRKVREALEPGGTLLLAEPMRQTRGAEPMGDAYFGFYLLAMGQGKPRSREELFALIREAGFRNLSMRQTRLPLLARVVVAN